MLRRCLTAMLACIAATPAMADDTPIPLGRAVQGITVTYVGDAFQINIGNTLVFEDGRELRCEDGHCRLLDRREASQEIRAIDPLEFGLHAPDLVGKRLKIVTGRVFAADLHSAIYNIPGGAVPVDLSAANVETIRYLVQNCHSLVTTDAKCRFALTGTVRESSGQLGVRMFEVQLSPAEASPPAGQTMTVSPAARPAQ